MSLIGATSWPRATRAAHQRRKQQIKFIARPSRLGRIGEPTCWLQDSNLWRAINLALGPASGASQPAGRPAGRLGGGGALPRPREIALAEPLPAGFQLNGRAPGKRARRWYARKRRACLGVMC